MNKNHQTLKGQGIVARISRALILFSALICGFSGQADTFTDPLTNGYSHANWSLLTNTSLFTITSTTTNGIVFSKPNGEVNTSIQYATLALLSVVRGDFSVQVDFTNAVIAVNGRIGDQIQLNTHFNGQDFLAVRSAEAAFGNSAHIYANPPGGSAVGVLSYSATYGTLRVVRTGVHVQGFINTNLLYENDYNTNDATFAFVLQNNRAGDATSCGFMNFKLTADQLLPSARDIAVQPDGHGNVILSWPNIAWPDFLKNYSLISTTNIAAPAYTWQVVGSSFNPLGTTVAFTNPITGPGSFFRFRQGQ